ncbi:hypothetical protein RMSM_00888 [Rhodopirellula maiorica SM1]|uniref:Uncharacterized protein n=1 Tax=Rhodopirellula maiorica SM1 TaxID=1265738 RepID=M5RSC3_9BACT|nr:hypothetical protein RMSM_00888 [Rhodopirellula maiorica SM1]
MKENLRSEPSVKREITSARFTSPFYRDFAFGGSSEMIAGIASRWAERRM